VGPAAVGMGKASRTLRIQHCDRFAAKCNTCCDSCWSRYSVLPINILHMQMLIQHLLETV
jgi:hypothetical protein